ncbi:MAG: hypothetical protein RR361_08455 [Anaerovorax sp.]
MKIFYRGLFGLLIITLPLVVILGGSSLALRMPDVYGYQLKANEIIDEIDLDVENDQLAQFFSDFMFGKIDELQMEATYRGRDQQVFSQGENIAMHHYKAFADKLILPLILTFIIGIISYVMLFLQEKETAMRVAFKIGTGIYALLMTGIVLLYMIPNTRTYFYHILFKYTFGSDDIVPLILTASFAGQMIVTILFISGIALALFSYATWQITKEKRMF